MAKKITKYSIFLASPSDLEEERYEIEAVIKELNLSYGNHQSLSLELLKWETHSAPAITQGNTQDIINKDIGQDYDIFIGLIWQKFGTKTEIADSGTEEEFLNALKRFENKENIQILFYFKNSAPKNLDDINLEELSKVDKFKKKLIEKNVLFWKYNEIEELKTNLRLHIPKRIETIKNSEEKNEVISIKEEEINEPTIDILEGDYGWLDYLIDYEKLFSDSLEALQNISEATFFIADEFTKKAEEITRIATLQNSNRQLIIELLKRLSKIMNDYTERVKTETPIFYDNFKEGIDTGLKYMNVMNETYEKDKYFENLRSTLESSKILRNAIPLSIDGVSSMHESIKALPKIQSDFNSSRRKLDNQLQELINKLEGTFKIISEFISEIEFRLTKDS